MGKWQKYWSNKGHLTKPRVENFQCFDCSDCYDKGNALLIEGKEISIQGCRLQFSIPQVSVLYPDKNTAFKYEIPVVTTKCNYGGNRHWFLCPIPKCNRRSKKLYFHSTGIFACRKCFKLAYTSQNRSKLDRIIDKKWNLIHRLGSSSSIPIRPKKMHHTTFDKIQNEIERLDTLATFGIAAVCR
jgi:hypothetical protein